MKRLKLVTLGVLALAFVACCPCRRSKSVVPLTGTEWHLTQLEGTAVSAEGYRMTLHVSGSRISGVGDCNRFSGTYTATPGSSRAHGRLSVPFDLASTRMMCPDQARENRFLAMLRRVDSYSIDGDRLMLFTAGDVVAIFEVAPPRTRAEGE